MKYILTLMLFGTLYSGEMEIVKEKCSNGENQILITIGITDRSNGYKRIEVSSSGKGVEKVIAINGVKKLYEIAV
jgi:hypothetical protein